MMMSYHPELAYDLGRESLTASAFGQRITCESGINRFGDNRSYLCDSVYYTCLSQQGFNSRSASGFPLVSAARSGSGPLAAGD